MYDPRIIANFVLDRAAEHGRPMTNLDIQKIVYLMHGHHLVRYQKPLVTGQFEAWTYGPVHRVLYDAFKSYADGPIESHATAFNPITRKRAELAVLPSGPTSDLICEFLFRYLDMPTFALVQLTHGEGTPWSQTVLAAEERVNVGMKIANSVIESSFEGYLQLT